jgi:hypothetical protein
MSISPEKVVDRYASQYHDPLRTPLLIDEFVIAIGNFLVYGYYAGGTNFVPKYFE